ncbi:hypothetical protein P280DRAFT_389613 [Massarina eburnea CBS 473.64]|uniref:F-box domain-containing protein n=1 Tax=Massarina eburnea CBS 473.64 TaxID=1395130 RepID=A0A6A6SFA8_9PLEO|nr:hypothetical protein P280DRAFT_389613 [Massarina eburnea CBS 473.64]
MEQSLANVTSYLPSPVDILLVVPRLLSKAGAWGEHIDGVFGKLRSGGSMIAEPTVVNATNATAATTAKFIQESVAAAAGTATSVPDDMAIFQALKNVGSFFNYMTSKWAIATFAIGILLNRTHFYASSRVPLSLDRLHMRLALYLVPMLLFVYRIQTVLQALRCQTAPDWSQMQYGVPDKQLETDFGGGGGFLWKLSSALLFFESAEDSCKAVNMFPTDPTSTRPGGSLALLWPLFVSLGFSQLVETLSCALQGRQPHHEVAMTIFEHSLAFAEAEAVVTRPFGLDSTRFYRPRNVLTSDGSSLTISRSTLNSFANVPPDLLLISLISSFSHFTSNFFAILGFRARFRLVTTTIWGLAYMATFSWSFFRFTTSIGEPGTIRFPTVCIVGFIPHLLILLGILACAVIYLFAFAFTVLSPPPGQPENLSWRERCVVAYGNLHANIHLSAITPLRVNWTEDFYTAILKVGFTVLTAASEAVYLNEGTRVNVHAMTWLEKKRLHDILARRRKLRQELTPAELRGDALAEGLEIVDRSIANGDNLLTTSGYGRERKTKGTDSNSDTARAIGRDSGVGVDQPRSRLTLTYQFIKGILFLLFAIQARLVMSILNTLRITYHPHWLVRLAGPRATEKPHSSASTSRNSGTWTGMEPWLEFDDRNRKRSDVSFDVEEFARERLRKNGSYEEQGPQESEEHLNNYLYHWWKGGGRWGDVDTSGDFVPSSENDDTTSVISFATTHDDDTWSDVEDEGQRTPTQRAYEFARESTPIQDNSLDLARLSHLLDPKTLEDREEARLLSRRLQNSGVLTRSQYRKGLEQDEAKLLSSSRLPVNGLSDGLTMTAEEEELLLEDMILNKRNVSAAETPNAGSWDTGAEGMGSEGPQCVGDRVDGSARLSPRTPSPRNRVAEYESAATSSGRKKGKPDVFEVVMSARKPDDTSCAVAKLPNEILTHALSHLAPNDLAAVSLVSKRFHGLVTTPHAWREAFSRYFPGPAALVDELTRLAVEGAGDTVRVDKRSFTRLTALASWRSEYILRTRLLRSVVRGKPVQVPSTIHTARSGQTQPNASITEYHAHTFSLIKHIHATFGTGLNKRVPRLVHGAVDVGLVTSSDPTTGKVDSWGQGDPNFYAQFTERFPGVAEWGLGSGEAVGCPNVMDVSQLYGVIYGQGTIEGSCYYRATDEQRGRFIAEPTVLTMHEAGVPKLGVDGGAICSTWIAKSNTIPSLSEGLIGLLIGSAAGVVTACSLGTDGLRGTRFARGELTARWVLSPGVPIVAITVDDHYSLKRQAQNRIWAVALNALGELFYLTKFPTRSQAPKGDTEDYTEYLAWLTGRSVYWNAVEPSRRTARPDPYHDLDADGSYSPRTSWDGMCLGKEEILAETKEIQRFLSKLPKDFRKSCLGWDMRRRLEVDFAGDDGNYAGEAMVVFECGLEENDVAKVQRYTRWKTRENTKSRTATLVAPLPSTQASSLFGGSGVNTPDASYRKLAQRARSSSYMSSTSSPERENLVEDWRCSNLTFGGLKLVQINTTVADQSTFANLTMSEDPALGFSAASTASSPYASPMSVASQPASPSDIPGRRGRFVAAGTRTGVVLLWDIRAPVSRSSEYPNDIVPIRIIYTDSPEITCIALSALYLVVGGNDGLVQAWDPLASDMKPIRTLNSRFSSRARRRLVQASQSAVGVGINMFAAGAIVIDPDPTILRGAVSLGNQIRYWSYSSSAADQYKSSKRRLRRAERGSNNANDRFAGTARLNLKDYIMNEKYELEREEQERRQHDDLMAGRFGIDLLGNEEEALAYATMLSQEAQQTDEARRWESENNAVVSNDTVIPELSTCAQSSSQNLPNDLNMDADIAEAIRLSLEDSPVPNMVVENPSSGSGWDVPVKFAKGKKTSPSRSKSSPTRASKAGGGGSNKRGEVDDLEYAIQLSLAEEQSRKEAQMEMNDFPPLNPTPDGGKGKGKGRMK